MQLASKDVFVTGATGFIGRRLVSDLLRKDIRVRAMVRTQNYPDSRLPAACEQIPLDLSDIHGLSDVIEGSSAIIYCAGSVRGRVLEDFSAANINGIKSLVAAIEQAESSPPLLLLSSLAASRPELSAYAQSKYQGEQVLRHPVSFSWTILRPPAVYGPGDREMLPVLKMVRRGLIAHAGPRDQRLSLIHVDDLVSAIVAWLSAPEKCLNETYAIDDGTAGGYSWQAIGRAVSGKEVRMLKLPVLALSGAAKVNMILSGLLGYSPMFSPGKVRELVQAEWLCENSAFTKATGWKPQIKLREGALQLFDGTHNSLTT